MPIIMLNENDPCTSIKSNYWDGKKLINNYLLFIRNSFKYNHMSIDKKSKAEKIHYVNADQKKVGGFPGGSV